MNYLYNKPDFRQVREPQRKFSFSFVEIFLFVAPMLRFLEFTLVGRLFATDLLLMLAFPIVLTRNLRLLRSRRVFYIVMLGLGWLVGQIITDFIRDTPPADYLRGWSKIALTILHFITLWLLINHSTRRFVAYGLGTSFGILIGFIFFPLFSDYATSWKMGLGFALIMLATIFTSMINNVKRRHAFSLSLLILLTLVSLALNSRGLGLIGMMMIVIIFFSRRKKGGNIRLQFVLALASLLLVGVAYQTVYSNLAESGSLGPDAKHKFNSQQGEGGVLLGGRSEILASGMAIVDSPIIGHGSWAKDPEYKNLLEERKRELGYAKAPVASADEIPTHSHIFGAWVEAGIMGFAFWLYIVIVVVQVMLKIRGNEPYLPLFVFLGLTMFWDIFFSPYGADRRFTTTYFICGILLLEHLQRISTAAEWARVSRQHLRAVQGSDSL